MRNESQKEARKRYPIDDGIHSIQLDQQTAFINGADFENQRIIKLINNEIDEAQGTGYPDSVSALTQLKSKIKWHNE